MGKGRGFDSRSVREDCLAVSLTTLQQERVAEMGDHGYGKDIAYLQGIVDKGGTVDRNNTIYQKLNSRRNINEVAEFLSGNIDGHLHS